MNSHLRCTVLAVFALGAGASPTLQAAEFVLDHAARSAAPTATLRQSLSVSDAEEIVVKIESTCPPHFNYLISATAQIDRPELPTTPPALEAVGQPTCSARHPFDQQAADNLCVLQSTEIKTRHNAGYDYDVRIQPKRAGSLFGVTEAAYGTIQTGYEAAVDARGFNCNATTATSAYNTVLSQNASLTKPLTATALTLITPEKERGWHYALAGGFSVSWLTDQEFEITGADDMRAFNRVKSAEDDQSLGLVAFIHLQNDDLFRSKPRWNKVFRYWAPLSFGVGTDSSDLDFFLGTSFRFREVAYVTAGYHWGQRDGRPKGQPLGAAPINDNVLTNLSSRTDGGFFLSASYKFLDFGGAGFLNKLFAPLQQPDESGDGS